MPETFDGLGPKTKVSIVFAGIILGAGCIAFALTNASSMSEKLYYGDPDREILESLYKVSKANTVVDPYLFVHGLNVQIHQKGIANRHALASLSIACGIALFAIGFSLFLIGADGAFKVQASKGASLAVSVSGTAPGLLCFVAATILVGIGATRKHELTIGAFRPPVPNSAWQVSSRTGNEDSTSAAHISTLERLADMIRSSSEEESP